MRRRRAQRNETKTTTVPSLRGESALRGEEEEKIEKVSILCKRSRAWTNFFTFHYSLLLLLLSKMTLSSSLCTLLLADYE
jgi:hypothetical protein